VKFQENTSCGSFAVQYGRADRVRLTVASSSSLAKEPKEGTTHFTQKPSNSHFSHFHLRRTSEKWV